MALRPSRLLPDRLRLPALLAVAVMFTAAGVWGASYAQRSAAERVARQSRYAQLMLTAMLDQETGLRGYLLTARRVFLRPYDAGRQNFDRALSRSRAAAEGEAPILRSIQDQEDRARNWQSLAAGQIVAAHPNRFGRRSVEAAIARKSYMDRFRRLNTGLNGLIEARRKEQLRDAGFVAVGVILSLGGLFGAFGTAMIRRGRRERRREREFVERLPLMRSEGEARELLREHVEATVHGSQVSVVTRDNGADPLPAATDSRSAGQPLVVGGEELGVVLLRKHSAVSAADRERLAEAAARAAPALANLRNLGIAETRARTDALTGLANKRAIRDIIRRMHAHAARTQAPLSVVLADLDHFKRINDTYGHECGDQALAAAAVALAGAVRASDFVGRMGGEEFIVLLPDTTPEAAAAVAEKLRESIRAVQIPEVLEGMTASFGVAGYPDHAVGQDALLRRADRALYKAKRLGRDRVEQARLTGDQPAETPTGHRLAGLATSAE